MLKSLKDEDDRAVIELFHEAWQRTMAQIGDRARTEGADFGRLIEVERERVRNSILRARTIEALTGWFMRFCASATKGGSLRGARNNADRLRALLFQARAVDRLQNLLLFALVSYASDSSESVASTPHTTNSKE